MILLLATASGQRGQLSFYTDVVAEKPHGVESSKVPTAGSSTAHVPLSSVGPPPASSWQGRVPSSPTVTLSPGRGVAQMTCGLPKSISGPAELAGGRGGQCAGGCGVGCRVEEVAWAMASGSSVCPLVREPSVKSLLHTGHLGRAGTAGRAVSPRQSRDSGHACSSGHGGARKPLGGQGGLRHEWHLRGEARGGLLVEGAAWTASHHGQRAGGQCPLVMSTWTQCDLIRKQGLSRCHSVTRGHSGLTGPAHEKAEAAPGRQGHRPRSTRQGPRSLREHGLPPWLSGPRTER